MLELGMSLMQKVQKNQNIRKHKFCDTKVLNVEPIQLIMLKKKHFLRTFTLNYPTST